MTKGATVGDNEVAVDIAKEDFINSINLIITLDRVVVRRTSFYVHLWIGRAVVEIRIPELRE